MPYPNQYFPQYQYGYQPQIQPPMDRLAQLQAQQYNFPSQMSGAGQQSSQFLPYVQGEAAAKSWMVGAGQSVLLMDSENPVFYIKSADGTGIPLPLRIFDYKERTQSIPQSTPQNAPQAQNPAQNDLDDKYVTRKEYNALQGKYEELSERLNSISIPNGNDATKRVEKINNNARNKGGTSNE